MPTPPTLRIISGHIYSPKGIANDTTVTITFGTSSSSVNSNDAGEYVIDASSVGATDGDEIILIATKSGEGTKSYTLTLATPQTQDFILEQTSDYNYDMHNTKYLVLQGAMLIDYEGNRFSMDNPIPVIVFNRALKVKSQYNTGGTTPLYRGEAPPGTLTSSPRWRIAKYIYGNGVRKPSTEVLWANGNGNFDKTWDSRTSYTYS